MMKTFESLIVAGKLKGTSDLKSIIHLALTFKKNGGEVESVVPPPFVISGMAFWEGCSAISLCKNRKSTKAQRTTAEKRRQTRTRPLPSC